MSWIFSFMDIFYWYHIRLMPLPLMPVVDGLRHTPLCWYDAALLCWWCMARYFFAYSFRASILITPFRRHISSLCHLYFASSFDAAATNIDIICFLRQRCRWAMPAPSISRDTGQITRNEWMNVNVNNEWGSNGKSQGNDLECSRRASGEMNLSKCRIE